MRASFLYAFTVMNAFLTGDREVRPYRKVVFWHNYREYRSLKRYFSSSQETSWRCQACKVEAAIMPKALMYHTGRESLIGSRSKMPVIRLRL